MSDAVYYGVAGVIAFLKLCYLVLYCRCKLAARSNNRRLNNCRRFRVVGSDGRRRTIVVQNGRILPCGTRAAQQGQNVDRQVLTSADHLAHAHAEQHATICDPYPYHMGNPYAVPPRYMQQAQPGSYPQQNVPRASQRTAPEPAENPPPYSINVDQNPE